MRLILVRHGQTKGNVDKITQGHLEGELTELGIEQAHKVAEWLKNEKVDKIFISDLKRTKDTAEPIVKHHKNSEKIYEKRVRERNFGVYEGKDAGLWIGDAEKSGIVIVEFEPEGGESLVQFHKRVKTFLEELEKTHKDESIMIVSHGGFITHAIFHLLNIPEEERRQRYFEFHPENTAVSIFDIKEGKNELIILNSTEHLTE